MKRPGSIMASHTGAVGRMTAPRFVVALLFLFALAAAAGAQNLAAWFAKPANQAAYGAIAEKVDALASSLKASSLSDSLLAARLEEAARKRVPAASLLVTLEADTTRYLTVSAALRDRSLLPENEKMASTAVGQAALLLRAGLGENILEASLDASLDKLGAKAGGSVAVSRAIATLSVVATAHAAYGLSDDECLFLAWALAGSDLADKRLDAALAPMKSIMAKGASASEALRAAIATLTKGRSGAAEAKAAEKSNAGKSAEKENQGKSGQKGNSGQSGNNGGGKKL